MDPKKRNQLLKSRIEFSEARNESVRNNRNISQDNLDLLTNRKKFWQKKLAMPQKRKSVTSDRVIESLKLAKGKGTVGYRKSITMMEKNSVIEEVYSELDGLE
jgi:response regulator of citrate/malate metabolism